MRLPISGGLWKNSEDEVLKAAIMKYGENQWDRVSSLLNRKSARKCKARWNEWLKPSIKKTEWTRVEDEELLNLARIYPSQWRTSAPLVGRTAAQCLERYERLLDAVTTNITSHENYEHDDPRRLRPGEVDPNPESRPARPDPVDMDDDEKEMLSEARARLANTKGKKAKRKAREKILEETRSLASLQKTRELKAAGMDDSNRNLRKWKEMDYNAEIPFQKKPPSGFFYVSEEDELLSVEQKHQFPVSIEDLEGKRRVDVEAQQRKQDIAKNKIANKFVGIDISEEQVARKRPKFMLPAPQISDIELEEIAKMGINACDFSVVTPRIGLTPSSGEALIRDELHINRDGDNHDKAKVKQQKQLSFSNLPAPKNEYQMVVQPVLEDDDEEEGEQELLGKMSSEELNMRADNSIEEAKNAILNEKEYAILTDFEEDELKQAVSMIVEEVQKSLGEAHKNYPAYCPSSIVENEEEPVALLSSEFEKAQKKLEKVKKKAASIENRVRVRTYGYENRAKNSLWPKIEYTFAQLDTATIELECSKDLQKQEQLAAVVRRKNLWEEVQKQKQLEKILQKRYGDILVEVEKVQHFFGSSSVARKNSAPFIAGSLAS